MGEIKKKLNISRITIKNLFLVILLMAVMAVISIAAKLIGNKVANTAQAQSCWTPPPPPPVGCIGSGGEGGDVGDGSCAAE